jgi:cyclopropane-fatty-acyl-phospholipid synthase
MDGLRFLERYLVGEVDIDSGIFLLHDVRDHLELGSVKWWQFLGNLGHNLLFQNVRRASVNVQSHYDIPQGCLDRYLDQVYFSYSCGMFEDVEPARYSVRDLNRIGSGEKDDWDSLEKAQWRKFHDSLSYLNPRQGESVLDIGAGYFGYAKLALEMFPDMGRIVGWTHSKNQVARGRELLQARDPGRYEVRYGDYREEGRVFDHVNSIGMVCHVGPRGLEPYVRNVRQRIRKGGRYLHHCMMSDRPVVLDNFEIGVVFNKRYVWPGFQYFPVTDHIHALQRNGFRIEKFVDLSDHYAKTVYAWARRFEAHIETMREHMTEPTVRAWRVYMAATGSFLRHRIITGRMYAVAV